ncbi:MAG: 3-hydroxyacyl-CoA dehydrogenase family protein, partial [Pseudomonadota bacterium]
YIDELVDSPVQLRWNVRRAILRNRKSRPAGIGKAIMGKWPMRGFVASKMLKETRKKVRPDHYPAPFKLIELFRRHGGSFKAIKRAETPAFAPLMISESSRNLRRVFHLSEQLKGQAPKNIGFKPLRVHVIGAGVMGADIAGFCVAAGMQVSLQDLSPEAIEKGIKTQDKLFKRRLKTKAERNAAKARLIADPHGDHIARADVVIEAIVERLDVKQKLFAELEPKLKPGAVLATNTSSIMIEDIAAPLQDPGRLIGIHFFNPVAQMPLVEIIKGTQSRDEEAQKGCVFVTAIGKFPLIVKSVPGFLVNRVLAPYLFGAFQRMEAGESMEKIDEAARAFGMPMGPIELADTVGLDVCAHVGEVLKGGIEGSKLADLVARGKLGKKTGEGFYKWKDGRPVAGDVSAPQSALAELGVELVQPLIDECIKCRDEGVVASGELVDAGVIFGTGFAPFRGGPLNYYGSLDVKNTAEAA